MKLIKIFFSFLITVSFIVICLTGSAYNDNINFTYPIKPGTTEWENLRSHPDKVECCQIPENILRKIQTDKLVDTVLDYPLLMELYAYNSYQKGFNAVRKNFNGLQELLKRKDAGSKLLEKYTNIEVSNEFFDIANIEIILAQKEILNQLTDDELKKLREQVQKKYNEKVNKSEIFRATQSTFYDVISENPTSKSIFTRN